MYRTNDGQVLKAATPEGIVSELRELSNTPSASDTAFMRDSADRIRAKLGRRVRTRDSNMFVADLLDAGLLINDDDSTEE